MNTLNKIIAILDKKDRKSLFILGIFLFISLLLEIMGIGMIIPLLSIFLDSNQDFLILFKIKDYNEDYILILFTLVIFILYVFKSIFLIVLSTKQNRFIYNLSARISNKIFENILNLEYQTFISKNSSEYVKTLQNEMSVFTAFLVYLLTIIVEGIFIIIIFLTILLVEPIGTLINTVVIGLSSVIFLSFFDKKLKYWGKKREQLDKKLFLILNSTLGGIKEIILLNRKSFFKNFYFDNNFLKSRFAANNQAVGQFPKIYLEFIAVFSIISFVITLNYFEYSNELILIKLGVFAFASFKILPSTSKIINAVQHLRFYEPSVDIIYNESKNTNIASVSIKELKEEKLFESIKIQDIKFSYDKKNTLLDGINFQIEKGDWFGIIGPSGSGKSTLIDLITGLIKPKYGKIYFNDILIQNIKNKNKWFGYVPQNIFLTDDSIINNITLGIEKNDIDFNKVKKILEQCEIEKFISKLPYGIYTQVGERGVKISGGQLQRIGIARALYSNPQILILDESTSSLDVETEKKILKTLKTLNKSLTIIMIAHRKETLINCNKVYRIS